MVIVCRMQDANSFVVLNPQPTPFGVFRLCTWGYSCQVDYPTKLSKMQNVSDITLFVSQNFGADSTVITYLGFKGEGTNVSRISMVFA